MEPALLQFQIRPPWKDELLRVREFMPLAFEEGTPAGLLIAVHGPLERIIAGAAIISSSETLRWRVAGERYRTRELLHALFAQIAKLNAEKQFTPRLRLAVMIDEPSLEADLLREVGFEGEAAHEVYEVSASVMWERLDSLHQRLTNRGVIPENAKLTNLTRDKLPEAAALLRRYLPEGEIALSREDETYKMEHSYVLLLDGAVKGLLLCRNHGEISHIGVVLVTQDLRGGYRWGNIALYHRSLHDALDYGVTRLRFTADPRLHSNTVEFARSWDAQFIGRKVRFFFGLPSGA